MTDPVASLLQSLHDSEINAALSSFHDGVFEWKLGDEWNGYRATGRAPSAAEALEELRRAALLHYPDSAFARTAGAS